MTGNDRPERPGSTARDRQRLDSWKAIARFLNRSERTVRRWERDAGLPVHRLKHQAGAGVFAYRDELQQWLDTQDEDAGASAQDGPGEAGGRPAVLVLPFAFVGEDQANHYVADGLCDELQADLEASPAITLIARRSAAPLLAQGLTAIELAERTGCTHRVEGSVNQLGSRLTLTLSISEAQAATPLRQVTRSGAADSLYAGRSELARAVLDALSTDPQEPSPCEPAPSPSPQELQTWRSLVIARRQAMRWSKDAIDDAVRLLEQAIAVSGPRPELLSALGQALLQYREAGIDLSPAILDRVRACADQILASANPDPKARAEGRFLLGWLSHARGRLPEAIGALEQAWEVRPDNLDNLTLLAYCLLLSGQLERGRAHVDRLLELDPLVPLAHALNGAALLFSGEFEAALGEYRLMHELDPSNPVGILFLVWALALSGDHEGLAEAARSWGRLPPESPPGFIVSLFLAPGTRDGQARIPVPAHVAEMARNTEMFARILAHACAFRQDYEQACDWLEVAIERGFACYPFLAEIDPLFAPCRDEPRFQRILADARERWLTLQS